MSRLVSYMFAASVCVSVCVRERECNTRFKALWIKVPQKIMQNITKICVNMDGHSLGLKVNPS